MPKRAVMRAHPVTRTLAVALAAALTLAALAACTSPPPSGEQTGRRAVAAPARPDLRTPDSTVRSYLDWVSYAYRIGDSSVASPTTSPDELVRIDSYLELNRQKGRLLDQDLQSLKLLNTTTAGGAAAVVTRETWRYRYVPLKQGGQPGRWANASYEATYTLGGSAGHWVVVSVDASATTPLQ